MKYKQDKTHKTILENFQDELDEAQKELEDAQEDFEKEINADQEEFEKEVKEVIKDTNSRVWSVRIFALVATGLVIAALIAIAGIFFKGWFMATRIRKMVDKVESAVDYGRKAKNDIKNLVARFQAGRSTPGPDAGTVEIERPES